MSEDVDKICRAIFFQLRVAKDLKTVTKAVEAIIGPANVSAVNQVINEMEEPESTRAGAAHGDSPSNL